MATEGTIGKLLFELRADDAGLKADVETKLRAVAASKGIKLPVDFDFAAAEKRVQDRISRLNTERGIKLHVDADTKTADEKLAALKKNHLDQLGARIRAITIDADIGKAETKLRSLEADAERSASRIRGSFATGLTAGFEQALNGIQSRLGAVGAGLDPLFTKLKDIGPAGAAAGLAAGVGLAAIGVAAKASVGVFTTLAAEVAAFKRTTGATAEDSSRLVAALDDVGISAQSAAPALAILARNADSKAFRALGIEVARTKAGTTDLIGTLSNIIQKADGIADPIQRANVVTAALGRNAAVLGPLFDKGADGFKKLLTSNEGQVLSESDLRKARDYKAALDNLGDAAKDLEIKFGRLLVPAITKVADGLGVLIDQAPKVASGVHLITEEIGQRFTTAVNRGEKGLQRLINVADLLAGPNFNFGDDAFGLDNGVTKPANRAFSALSALTGAKVSSGFEVVKNGVTTSFGGAIPVVNAFDAAIRALPGSIGASIGASQQLGKPTADLTKQTDAYASSLAKLNDTLGVGLAGQIRDGQAKLDAARSTKTLLDAQVAITKAKQNEADVARNANQSIIDAEQRINDVRARGPKLLVEKARAERDAVKSNQDLTRAITDQKKAQEESERVLGRLPPKIADVTKALREQFNAQDALNSLSDDLAANDQRIADAKEKLANFDSNGSGAANDKVRSLQLAVEDANKRVADAEKALSAAQADPTKAGDVAALSNDLEQAQIAARGVLRDQKEQSQDILDLTAQRAALVRDLNGLERQHGRLLEDQKQKAGEVNAAAANASEVQKGSASFELDSPRGGPLLNVRPLTDRQQKASDGLTTANKGVQDAAEKAAAAQQTVVDKTADITKNEQDLGKAIADRALVYDKADKARKQAHTEYLAAIAAEKTAVQQAGLDTLKGLKAQSDKFGEVKKGADDVQTAVQAILDKGGAVPNLDAFTDIRTALLKIGDDEVLAKLDAAFASAGRTTLTGGPAGAAPVATVANRVFGPPAPSTLTVTNTNYITVTGGAGVGAAVTQSIFDSLADLAAKNGGVLAGLIGSGFSPSTIGREKT